MAASQVICSDCGREHPFGALGLCAQCGGILQPVYADATVAQLASIRPGRGIDRYRPLLPVEHPIPNLGEGDTPLLPSRVIGPGLGLNQVYFKNEGVNPSGAFKDRTGSMAAALAMDAGARGVVTASSGNAAAAIATYCAAAGLACTVLLEPGNPPAKLRQTLAAGAQVIPVAGIFRRGPAAARELILAVAEETGLYPGFVWAPVNPYILEGIKTISYEVGARLPGGPDVVVCPVGGGDMLTAQWRGYLELKRAAVIAETPRMVAVQSHKAPPLLEAYRKKASRVETLPSADSQVSGINVPFSGDHALAAVYESEGAVVGVEDNEVFAMQARLAAEEGIWAEPAGATAVAALARLRDEGIGTAEERIVCIISGAGFKDTELAAEAAGAIARQTVVAFDAAAVAKLIS